MVSTTTKTFDTAHGRILCIADIRGRLSAINDLAREVNAVAVIHTGDFGFFETNSLDRINDRTLRHLTMYSPLVASAQRTHLLQQNTPLRNSVDISILTEFPLLVSGNLRLNIPVYTVWGACEDVVIMEKFRAKTYEVPNLNILDEATTHLLDLGGVKLRLLGLGGAVVPHKMFDNGDGSATIAGGQGTMWTTTLQIGELVDTAQRIHDPSETRLLVTHASPGREGLIAQLALVCKADLTISAGLHFRYSTSWNEFSVLADYEGFRRKLLLGKEAFDKVWESVKAQVGVVVDENQRVLLDKALNVVERIPPPLGPGGAPTGMTPAKEALAAQDEPMWKNCWNWNLCDAAYGSLILDVREGRISAELKSQGFNYAYRRSATVPATPTSANANNILSPHTKFASKSAPSAPNGASPAPPSVTHSKPATPPIPPSSSNANVQNKTFSTSNFNQAIDRAVPPHLSGRASTTRTSSKPESKPTSGTGTPLSEPPDSNQKDGAKGEKEGIKDGAKDNQAVKLEKAERDKQKRKEKKERKEKEKAVATAGGEGPVPVSASTTIDDLKSPIDQLKSPASASGTLSGGARTPRLAKPPRNPWTIFMRMNVPASESDLREFYGDNVKDGGVIRVSFPSTTGAGRAQKLAYVEFGDEETMRRGLERTGQTLNGNIPELKQATDKETREREQRERAASQSQLSQSQSAHDSITSPTNSQPHPERSGSYRGRGRGGGGFASRGLAAAGLTRGGRGGAGGSGS
ncbi:hypothetical protein J3R30DRAFT_1598991 [Lentinula aciculospora]|uniref:RRM domain-containing protein n=1 Tax=Lentinula aciculospora TaxID=153920 RepID=A0A9W8ZX93_9AGAR|nr:hypothetical protein J3R30DRAFT_1598991 [Lentinula aciculospora]